PREQVVPSPYATGTKRPHCYVLSSTSPGWRVVIPPRALSSRLSAPRPWHGGSPYATRPGLPSTPRRHPPLQRRMTSLVTTHPRGRTNAPCLAVDGAGSMVGAELMFDHDIGHRPPPPDRPAPSPLID